MSNVKMHTFLRFTHFNCIVKFHQIELINPYIFLILFRIKKERLIKSVSVKNICKICYHTIFSFVKSTL